MNPNPILNQAMLALRFQQMQEMHAIAPQGITPLSEIYRSGLSSPSPAPEQSVPPNTPSFGILNSPPNSRPNPMFAAALQQAAVNRAAFAPPRLSQSSTPLNMSFNNNPAFTEGLAAAAPFPKGDTASAGAGSDPSADHADISTPPNVPAARNLANALSPTSSVHAVLGSPMATSSMGVGVSPGAMGGALAMAAVSGGAPRRVPGAPVLGYDVLTARSLDAGAFDGIGVVPGTPFHSFSGPQARPAPLASPLPVPATPPSTPVAANRATSALGLSWGAIPTAQPVGGSWGGAFGARGGAVRAPMYAANPMNPMLVSPTPPGTTPVQSLQSLGPPGSPFSPPAFSTLGPLAGRRVGTSDMAPLGSSLGGRGWAAPSTPPNTPAFSRIAMELQQLQHSTETLGHALQQ